MAESAAPGKTSWHFWTVGIVSLLWNSIGGLDYVMTKTRNPDWLASFTPEQVAWFESFPLWANIAWALGVWGAFAGSVLLLMKKAWAYQAFAISFAGLVLASIYQFGLGNMPKSLMTTGGMVFTAILWAIAIFLVWYAAKLRRDGVLR
jgi:hypothetical protein